MVGGAAGEADASVEGTVTRLTVVEVVAVVGVVVVVACSQACRLEEVVPGVMTPRARTGAGRAVLCCWWRLATDAADGKIGAPAATGGRAAVH